MKLYGLIGFPLTHSFSKNYFMQKFESEGIEDCRFENFELDHINEVQTMLQHNPSLQGFAITIPHKKKILPFLTDSTADVQEMQACNCVKLVNGKLYGFNTDTIGFVQSLQKHLQPHHTKALILGSGGAANAVEFVFRKLKIDFLTVSRSKSTESNIVSYEDLTEEIMDQHTLIINATPLGTFPKVDEFPPIPYQFITSGHYLFDLVYNPDKTRFLEKGEEKGAAIQNGYDMLTIQAEENWKIWNS
jgi:shikimate dehydrogenase